MKVSQEPYKKSRKGFSGFINSSQRLDYEIFVMI
jgi:hypothetical protein